MDNEEKGHNSSSVFRLLTLTVSMFWNVLGTSVERNM